MYIPIPFQHCIQLCGNKPFNSVVHIGAHHGEEINAYASSGVKSVAWFEAYRPFMMKLHDQTNPYQIVKQTYINECLSDVDNEEVEFNVANNGQSSSILELGTHAKMYPHIVYDKKVSVKTKRFDQIYEKHEINMDEVDFINIDVQGAELKVLKGFGDLLNKPNIRAIYTEVNFEEVYEGCCLITDLDEYLGSFGFTRASTAAPEKTWGDALYNKVNK